MSFICMKDKQGGKLNKEIEEVKGNIKNGLESSNKLYLSLREEVMVYYDTYEKFMNQLKDECGQKYKKVDSLEEKVNNNDTYHKDSFHQMNLSIQLLWKMLILSQLLNTGIFAFILLNDLLT